MPVEPRNRQEGLDLTSQIPKFHVQNATGIARNTLRDSRCVHLKQKTGCFGSMYSQND